jgi:AAA domain
MASLPLVKSPQEVRNPRRLVVIGLPKSGKTTALAKLDNNCILDCESGSVYMEALRVKVQGIRAPKEAPERKEKRNEAGVFYLDEFEKLVIEYRKQNNGQYPYKYITIDTVTEFEKWLYREATLLFMDTVKGKKFNRDEKSGQLLPENEQNGVIEEYGANGYQWLRDAWELWIGKLSKLAPHLILVGHVRDKNLDKADTKLVLKEIDLTGKIANMLVKDADASCFVSRKNNKVTLNFKASDIIVGARPVHLRDKEIVISELKPDGTIETFWNEIYID